MIQCFIILFFLVFYKNIYKSNEHPSVANTFYSIAQQYSSMGQYEMALEKFHEVLGRQLKLYIERRRLLKVVGAGDSGWARIYKQN